MVHQFSDRVQSVKNPCTLVWMRHGFAHAQRPAVTPVSVTSPQVVEDFGDLHLRAWEAVAAEEGKPVPPRWMLRRAEGMKNEQVDLFPRLLLMLTWYRVGLEQMRLSPRLHCHALRRQG